MLEVFYGHSDGHLDDLVGHVGDHHGDLLPESFLQPTVPGRGRLTGTAAPTAFLLPQPLQQDEHGGEIVAAVPVVNQKWPARLQHGHRLSTEPTAFHPFILKCPPAAKTELGAISAAMKRAKEAEKLLHEVKAYEAFHLVSRAIDRLSFIKEIFTYLIYKLFMDLPSDLFLTRMELEQAAQNAHRYAVGSKAGDILACAANDLWPYDPHPNIHPMDRRLSEMPLSAAALGAPPWESRPTKRDSPSSLADFL